MLRYISALICKIFISFSNNFGRFIADLSPQAMKRIYKMIGHSKDLLCHAIVSTKVNLNNVHLSALKIDL